MEVTTVSGLSSDPPRHMEYRWGGGGETTGKMRQIEITANSLFYWSRIRLLNVYKSTYTYILLAALIF
jgi:hypothetical protein